MTRGTIQEFLEAAAGTASQVFGEPTQRVAREEGGTAKTELKVHPRFGVGSWDRVGQSRARPRNLGSAHYVRFLPPAVDHRKEHGRRRQDAGR